MNYLTALLLAAASFTAAAPTNNTLTTRSGFTGDIKFFERWDCTNPCVEKGYCPFNKQNEGMSGAGESPFIGWSTGCWDRPASAHSLSLAISNGHKFSAVGVSCKEFVAGKFSAKTWPIGSGKNPVCTPLGDASIKAVFYHWENN